MKKLFRIKCNGIPDCFFKAENEQAARMAFANGLEDPFAFFNDPSFNCQQIHSLNEWLTDLPDEFVIVDEVAF